MSRTLCTLTIFAVLAASPLHGHSQSTTPATPPAQTNSSSSTLKTNATIVVVDVVVTDKNQKPIHNLKASDFNLSEDGTPQTLKNFEEHTTLSPAEAAKLPPAPKLPPGIFSNYSAVPPGALNVLLFDALNTPMKDQVFVHDQLLQYLKNAPRGARIAIFGLNERLVMLQGFTSEPDVLKAVVEKKDSASASHLLDDPLAGDGNPNAPSDALRDLAGDDVGYVAILLGNLKQVEAQQTSYETQYRTKQTLDAFNALAHYLSAFPGRKNLIWFSASFPLSILPKEDLNYPFSIVADSEDEFRETSTLLARSQVAVYPIDARGITNPYMENAAIDPVGPPPASTKSARGTPATLAQQAQKALTPVSDATKRSRTIQEIDAEHGTMEDMAFATGGRALVENNGLADAVARGLRHRLQLLRPHLHTFQSKKQRILPQNCRQAQPVRRDPRLPPRILPR